MLEAASNFSSSEKASGYFERFKERIQELRAGVKKSSYTWYPLSNSQVGMWLHQYQFKASPAYNLSYALELGFPFDKEILRESLTIVVKRHPVLRTTFRLVEGVPQQAISDVSIPLEVRDLTAHDKDPFEVWVRQEARKQARVPFDLETGPLARLSLVQYAKDHSVLIFTIHHIIFDGWSSGIFIKDLVETYTYLRDGTSPQAFSTDNPFKAMCLKQKEALSNGEMDGPLLYWYNRLFPAPAAVDLPYDYSPKEMSFKQGEMIHRSLSPRCKSEIEKFAHQFSCAPFVVYMSAFYALIYRLTGQDRVMVGVSIANRADIIHRDSVGPFAEVLPMISNIRPGMSFHELLQCVKEEVGQDLENSEISLSRLVEMVYPHGLPVRNSLFQVGFDFQNFPWPKDQGGIVLWEGSSGAAKIDLNLSVSCFEDGMICNLEYCTDVFKKESIETILDSYCKLLEDIPFIDNKTKITDLDLVSPSQRNKLNEWRLGPRKSYPFENWIGSWIESHAQKLSSKSALEFRNQSLTYGEMGQLICRLSHALKSQGIGAGDVVMVQLEPCLHQIPIMLAIWKTGACYFPIDPTTGPSRLQTILDQVKPKASIARQASMCDGGGLQLGSVKGEPNAYIKLSMDQLLLNSHTLDTAPWTFTPESIAYLVFTSGSTGIPKGVKISHQALHNFAHAAQDLFRVTVNDRVLQFAPAFFDASFEEILPALCAGATLVIKDPAMLGSPQTFLERIKERKITLMDLPSSFWHELVSAWSPGETDVHTVIVGGEAVLPSKCVEWMRKESSERVRLLNTYGVSEATVVSTYCEVSAIPQADLEKAPCVPVGRPFSNLELRVMDLRGKDVALPGAFGEVWIGGIGVGTGHLGFDKGVNTKFISRGGQPFYRTGDIGRFRPDGMLELKGRLGAVTKIRGFLVDPAEIEGVIAKHPQVKTCAVLVKEEETHRQQTLFAHLSTVNGESDLEAIKKYANDELPHHLRPQHYKFHSKLPLTPSGKIDKKALLECSHREEERSRTTRGMPLTFIEETIASIWHEVLGISDIGIYDDFFSVGGNSLLAIRMLSGINSSLEVNIDLVRVFDDPTISALASAVELAVSRRMDAPHVERSNAQNYSYDFSDHERAVFQKYASDVGLISGNLPLAFRASGPLRIADFVKAVNQTIEHVDCLRTHFDISKKRAFCRSISEHKLDWSHQVISGTQEERNIAITAQLAEETAAAINLDRSFPVKLRFYEEGPEAWTILLVFHEAVIDQKSIAQFLEEVFTAYQRRSGRSDDLSHLKTQQRLQQRDYNLWDSAKTSFAVTTNQDRKEKDQALTDPPMRLRQLSRLSTRQCRTIDDLADHLSVNPRVIWVALIQMGLLRNFPSPNIGVEWTLDRRPMPDMQGCIGSFGLIARALPGAMTGKSFAEIVKEVQSQAVKTLTESIQREHASLSAIVTFDKALTVACADPQLTLETIEVYRPVLPGKLAFGIRSVRDSATIICEWDQGVATNEQVAGCLEDLGFFLNFLTKEALFEKGIVETTQI